MNELRDSVFSWFGCLFGWALFATLLLCVAYVNRSWLAALFVELHEKGRRASRWSNLITVFFVGVCITCGALKPDDGAPEGQCLGMRPLQLEAASEVSTDPQQGVAVPMHEWNAPGAWETQARNQSFADDFVFPYAANHLSRVHVFSQGSVRESRFATNEIASLGVPVAVVPGLTECSHEHTVSNTYLFTWVNAAANRDTNTLVTGSIELYRNGDTIVTSNGIARSIPRALPFAYDGYGQDDDWVRANFTNADDILSVGYANWVDAQVGVDLTNGFYKFTATFDDYPPEATQLYVGDYSVCVTAPGDYTFVLEKGTEYEFGTWPYDDAVTYYAQDDVGADSPMLLSWWGGEDAPGEWSIDGGWLDFYWPDVSCNGYCCWVPTLQGSPNVSYLGQNDFPCVFSAVLTDCPATSSIAYCWTTSNEGIQIASPLDQTTQIDASDMPDWRDLDLGVSAYVNGYELYSSLCNCTYGYDDERPSYYDVSSLEILNAHGSAIAWSEPVLVNEDIKVKVSLSESCDSASAFAARYEGTVSLRTYSVDSDGEHAIRSATIPMSADAVTRISDTEFVVSVPALWLQVNELVSNANDTWQEKTTIDDSSAISGSGGLRGDSDVIDSGLSGQLRGRVRGTGNASLALAIPEGVFNLRYLKAGGTAFMVAETACCGSDSKPVQQQSDLVYYSCHGYHISGKLADEAHNSYSCDEITELWGDVKIVIVAGCSVLDIKSYRSDCFELPTRVKRFFKGGGSCSPGEQWESKGAQVYLGYAWRAPTDSGGGVSIASTFVSRVSAGMDYIEAWKEANASGAARNACAIDCRTTPHTYWYWREENGTATWTSVMKGTSGW